MYVYAYRASTYIYAYTSMHAYVRTYLLIAPNHCAIITIARSSSVVLSYRNTYSSLVISQKSPYRTGKHCATIVWNSYAHTYMHTYM